MNERLRFFADAADLVTRREPSVTATLPFGAAARSGSRATGVGLNTWELIFRVQRVEEGS